MLSILIPTYNTVCIELVRQLHAEAATLGVPFELLVADDGSRPEVDAINRQITTLEHGRYLRLTENIGPARIRNYLADQAQYSYLLFLDADTRPVRSTFLADYLQAAQSGGVVCGGFCYRREKPAAQCALRYYYGIRVEEKTAAERNRQPYTQFIGMSFLADRDVFSRVRFDESMHFGYEDAYFGILLKQAEIPLHHVDNPVYHLSMDTAAEYLEKIRRSVRNLSLHMDKQRPYIRLLHWYTRLEQYRLTGLTARIFSLARTGMEKNLTSSRPSLTLFACYKLGYLCWIRLNERMPLIT